MCTYQVQSYILSLATLKHLVFHNPTTQRSQYPLIEECTLNQKKNSGPHNLRYLP